MVMKRTLKPLLTWAELQPSSTQISMVPKAFSLVTRCGYQLKSILLTFHSQGSVVKSALSTNAKSRFVSDVFDGVLGPQHHARAAHLMVSFFLWSIKSFAWSKPMGPLKGAVSAQKALQGSRTETRELLHRDPGDPQSSIPTLLYSPWKKNSHSKSCNRQKFSIWDTNRCFNILNITVD